MKKILVGIALTTFIISTTQAEVAKPGVPPPTVSTQAPINCDYKIPASTKTIEPSLVLTWSENAALQAFNLDPATLDAQMQKLKNCFTDQGWTSFNSALEKSGNLETIKTQKLMVSSQLKGKSSFVDTKNNQWKISLPLQVTYKNDKEKVNQLLNVSLSVTRKINGDLGITQMVAAPNTSNTSLQAISSTPDANPASTVNNPVKK